MSAAVYQFDEKENQIRTRWLNLTFVNMIVFPILILILNMLYQPKAGGPYEVNNLLVTLVFEIIFFTLYYFCTYKGCGTKLLTFTIISFVLTVPLSFFAVIYEGTVQLYASMVLSLPFSIWWFLLCIQLRKVYRKKKEEVSITTGTSCRVQ